MSEQASQPGFWSRLGRALAWTVTTTLKVLFLAAVVALIIAGGWYAVTTVEREYNAVQRRLALLEAASKFGEENDIAHQAEIRDADSRITALGADLDNRTAALADDIARQNEQLAALEGQLATLAQATTVISDSVAVLNEVAAGLQGDLNANLAVIDALGGDADVLRGRVDAAEAGLSTLGGELTGLSAVVDDLTDADAALAEMRTTLTLFRAWELVSRARLRLAQGNLGLAADDVVAAQQILDTVGPQLAGDGETPGTFAALQTRLTLVGELLTADPLTAADDLDVIWNLLDAAISARLAPPQ